MSGIHALKQREAAELVGVSARALRDWTDAPRNPDGTYSGPALVAWLLERDSDGDLDLDRERARLAKAQADRTEMENAVRKRELLEVADVESEWTELVMAARAHFLGMHAKLAPQLATMTDLAEIAALIKREVWSALAQLANDRTGMDDDAERTERSADRGIPPGGGDGAADAGDVRAQAGGDQPHARRRRARRRGGGADA